MKQDILKFSHKAGIFPGVQNFSVLWNRSLAADLLQIGRECCIISSVSILYSRIRSVLPDLISSPLQLFYSCLSQPKYRVHSVIRDLNIVSVASAVLKSAICWLTVIFKWLWTTIKTTCNLLFYVTKSIMIMRFLGKIVVQHFQHKCGPSLAV